MKKDWDINESTMDNYLQCCCDAYENEEVFNNFKKDDRYTPILEHVSYGDSLNLIAEMGSFEEFLDEELLEKIKLNDSIGNSTKYNYNYFGEISPSTIRYIKNSIDILRNFDTGKIKTVVEIGGGYGGLCKVLHDFIHLKSYTIIDLKEPLLLSKKYLNSFGVGVKTVSPEDSLEFKGNAIDLLISNYAFSEVSRELQQSYIDKVISKSKNFYIIYNSISNSNLTCEEFVNLMRTNSNIKISVVRDYQNNNIIYGNSL